MVNSYNCSPASQNCLAFSLPITAITKPMLHSPHASTSAAECGWVKVHCEQAPFQSMTLCPTKLSRDISKPHAPFPFSLQIYYYETVHSSSFRLPTPPPQHQSQLVTSLPSSLKIKSKIIRGEPPTILVYISMLCLLACSPQINCPGCPLKLVPPCIH